MGSACRCRNGSRSLPSIPMKRRRGKAMKRMTRRGGPADADRARGAAAHLPVGPIASVPDDPGTREVPA